VAREVARAVKPLRDRSLAWSMRSSLITSMGNARLDGPAHYESRLVAGRYSQTTPLGERSG
jgi:hypothetical protein